MKQVKPLLKKNILFVCLGNICRSPIAEGIFRKTAVQQGLEHLLHIESAGTSSWHIGSPPDMRAQAAAQKHGVDISDLRARRVTREDFETFDLLLAMDRSNRKALLKMVPPEYAHKIALFMDFAPTRCVHEIPDPYFGEGDGFDYACQLIDAASRGLIVHLEAYDESPVQRASTAKSTESLNG